MSNFDLTEELESRVQSTGLKRIDEGCGSRSNEFGTCSSCTHLLAARTQYKIRWAKCAVFDKPLAVDDPIIECTSYYRTGSMTLYQMASIATLIDVSKNNEPIGFKGGSKSGDEDEEEESPSRPIGFQGDAE